MFALQACPVAMASVRLHGFAFTSELPNGRLRLRQLTQVRTNCHLQRKWSLHGLGMLLFHTHFAIVS